MPLSNLRVWRYCHPMALIYYLSTLGSAFGNLMEACSRGGLPMRLIIYIDELCPGNPLRPEKSRTLQAIYWAFADWPQHVLQRTAAWPVFGTIRSTLVEKLPGGVAGFLKRVMLTFFAEVGHNMSRGFTFVKAGGERIIRRAIFAGFLCDEKAHNQICGNKGASGTPHASVAATHRAHIGVCHRIVAH